MTKPEGSMCLDEWDDGPLIHFIQEQMPERLQGVFTDNVLQFFLDAIADYYVEHNTFGHAGTGGVKVKMDKVAAHVQQRAEEEGLGTFSREDIEFVVEQDLVYNENA